MAMGQRGKMGCLKGWSDASAAVAVARVVIFVQDIFDPGEVLRGFMIPVELCVVLRLWLSLTKLYSPSLSQYVDEISIQIINR